MNKIKTIALDLEGTLISTAISVFPRNELYDFLVFCNANFNRLVMFTAVKEIRFRSIAKILTEEKSVPEWFSSIEYINWNGKYKDLTFIPESNIKETVIIDDNKDYINPMQLDNWIPVVEFKYPYNNDYELRKIIIILSKYCC